MFGLINHLTYRKSIARAQVKHVTAAPRLQPFQPQNMVIQQIANMHIIADILVASLVSNYYFHLGDIHLYTFFTWTEI
jgi:hypothetical protein